MGSAPRLFGMVVTLRPEIAALQPYRQGRPAADDAFKLSSNENPFPPLQAVLDAIAQSSVNRYPDGAATALRTRLAERYGVPLDEVQVGAGSVSILQQLIQAAAGPGDGISVFVGPPLSFKRPSSGSAWMTVPE